MLRAARARRIATATAFGGGGLTLLGAGTMALLYLQARLAYRAIGFTSWTPPEVEGVYGGGTGPPIEFAILGDSTAAGFALTDGPQTPGALLAAGISEAAHRPVRLRSTAKVGATSADLVRQAGRLDGPPPDLAVVFIGANDVIHRVRPADAVHHLQSVVRALHAQGAAVVVATCPDLGSVRPIGQPLRAVARRASRQLAAAQTIAVVEEGGRTVSLTDLLADDFSARPEEMFGPDRFHPSARGYAHAATAVLPSACAALGLLAELETPLDRRGGEGVLPVDRAAVEAAEEPGMEVSGVQVAGRERGPRGRWAALLRRGGRARPGAGAQGAGQAAQTGQAGDTAGAGGAESTAPTRA
ncbi:SGNH/GDSL hydrolase family protein [Nocardiopsis suaedae]|uniref:SGNH/GDSL hydrolase family protein n=1 Tax=Nocardiopsis suaedae TaxID=3018444 RepID=A0ABT4TVT1_9ACTN|nr:SGNH/GDSL hydrolase family protein [Nocardiopsis suaedae]MDA2808800.1 SGNH/GDSL hydrolase family protein [Nocardiopsis suaedae]